MDAQSPPRWYWRRLWLDRNGSPDEQIFAAAIGQGTLLFLIGWMLWHGTSVSLTDYATAQGAIWGSCGLGKMLTGMNGGYGQPNSGS